ncbi:extended synaptotagmin-3 [Xenopus tropicalis]|uniref:Extended synaptotagmin-3 n=2 Tax=Xenopus tropicalis TaxID=8364 RepID=ESYT3_XENTR|nr:extended synaptotagmin-3 [Xenopus tropicalis]Q5M7N9.1 RecName: Full=Extended synaptotagmin-3; Short=E-Syt3 [Xenopus tropicalis]AAH88530.1 family with sequence similarity 62 (C2 domain containing), member A [Xenopus tropicalis]|eukprot:NP_001011364.1 extended synaptotagmin-3 [Xenopus tropicalis]
MAQGDPGGQTPQAPQGTDKKPDEPKATEKPQGAGPQPRDPPGGEKGLRDPPGGEKGPRDPGQGGAGEALAEALYGLGRPVLRAVLYLFPVYLCGRFGLSPTWLLFGLFLWMFWTRNKKFKLARIQAAWDLHENEKLGVTRGLYLQQLPAWVNFPDVERVEWLNKVVGQMWPYIGMYVEKMFQDKVEPLVRSSSAHLKAFTFTKVHLGEKFPRINGVKSYTKNVDKREVILDLQLSYNGDVEINVEVKKMCKAGVKGVQLHGTLRVILAPLLPDLPFVGAVTMFFIQRPHLDINWTGLTNVLEIPGVSDFSDSMIVDMIASHLVLPNRFTVPLSSQVQAAQLRFPLPHGVLRLHLIEAEDLIPKDNYLKGIIRGKSDPYAVLRIGNQNFKSRTIKENLNPKWGEMYEFVVHEVPGQDLEVDLYDEDPDKDDFLGSLVIGLEGVMQDRVVDEWFPLSDVPSGSVHLRLEWLSLLPKSEKLSEAKGGISTAMLIVYLDSASALPRNHFEYSSSEYTTRKQRHMTYTKTDKDPNSYVLMSVGKKSVKSKTCTGSTEPVWGQAFAFFIQDVHMQHLHLEVKDSERQCALGMLDLPLHRLLGNEELTADQRFPLANSGPNSTIKMKIVLRVLHVEAPEPESIYTGINSLKQGPVSIKRAQSQQHKSHGKSHQAHHQAHQTQQNHTVQQPKAERKESISTTSQQANTSSSNPAPNQNPNSTGAVPESHTPSLKPLERIAPSLLSLNSIGSSVFDPNDKRWPSEMTGEVEVSVRYASLRRCLVVLINSCRNLIQCSSNGADPYVRIYLLPDRKWSGRKKTSVKRKTLNPQYNERFEFLVSQEEAKKRMLDVAVKNNRGFGSHERKELGKVLVDLSCDDLVKGFTKWFELTPTGLPTS